MTLLHHHTKRKDNKHTKREKKKSEMQRAYYPIHKQSEAIPSLFYAYNKTARGHRGDGLQLLGESNPNLR